MNRSDWTSRLRGRWVFLAALAVLLFAAVMLAVLLSGDSGSLRFFRQDSTWQQMEQRGTWRVGMDPSFPPFESLDAEGRPVGYDVDLGRQMAQAWEMDIEIVAIGFDSLIDALQAGKIDSIISALPLDPRLTKDIAYSEPYFEAGIRLAVADDSVIDDLASLSGHTVAVEWGSMGDMVGRRLQRQEVDIDLAQYPTPQEAVDALADKRVDALLIDNVTLRQAQGEGAAIHAVGPALESNPYVIAMPRRAGDLQPQVAETLSRLQEDGTMAEIEATWFGLR